jgi:methyltransferase (TIGR00027 family)
MTKKRSISTDRASQTAELMAFQRGLESTRPARERLFTDPYAGPLLARRWRLLLACARIAPARRLLEAIYDRAAGPGPRASAVARTRLIDETMTGAVAGVDQVVILGAGFDSRAYRLAALQDCTVFEVDQPATQAVKRERSAPLNGSAPASIRHVAVDFEHDDLRDSLIGCGYRPEAPAIFLWEGVTNYLTAAAVDGTLAAIRALAAPGSTLLFTYVDRAALERPDAFPEAARWLQAVRRRGEPWTFGLAPAAVGAFLSDRGFSLRSDSSTAEAGQAYFRPRGRPERGSALYRVVSAAVA